MNLEFTKMHGLGNDFVVVDAISTSVTLTDEQIRFIADRRTGIGCDQLLMVEHSTHPDADFNYRIFNSDGGEVEHCGNGARCFALFVRKRGLTHKTCIPISTCAGLIEVCAEDDGQFTVAMGIPSFIPADIPFHAEQQQARYTLDVNDQTIDISALAISNPHAVIDVESTETAEVETIGPQVESHRRFPKRVNVGFRELVDRRHIRLRVFERGVGETRACGTGACAAVVSGIADGILDSTARVSLPGGDLMVHWSGVGRQVMMTGPADTVFQGAIEL